MSDIGGNAWFEKQEEKIARLSKHLSAIQAKVRLQQADESIWPVPVTAAEDVTLRHLRDLHSVIEGNND